MTSIVEEEAKTIQENKRRHNRGDNMATIVRENPTIDEREKKEITHKFSEINK